MPSQAIAHTHGHAHTHREDLHGDVESDECHGGSSHGCRGRACSKQHSSSGAVGASSRGIRTHRHTAAADHGDILAVSAAPLDLQHAPCLAQDHYPRNRQQASQHAADDAAGGNACDIKLGENLARVRPMWCRCRGARGCAQWEGLL